ncbi:MAG: hypothetical protein AAF433_20490 [Bacteroidota bacterium]
MDLVTFLIFGFLPGVVGAFISRSVGNSQKSLQRDLLTGGIFGLLLALLIWILGLRGPIVFILSFAGGLMSPWLIKETSQDKTSKPYIKPSPKNTTKRTSPNFRILKFRETSIVYEPDGQETRRIDNSRGNGLVRRRLTITREWKKSINYSTTDIHKKGKQLGLAPQLFSLKTSIDQQLEERYSLSSVESRLFSEELEIEIMPYSEIILRIDWKRVWQEGEIELVDQQGNMLSQPYRVSKGLTFDQTLEKIN